MCRRGAIATVGERGRGLLSTAPLVVAAVVVLAGCSLRSHPTSVLPLQPVTAAGLPGDGSRFDYASLDGSRGLLFIAHLGASEVIEVDVRAHTVVRTITDVPQVHGVLVVPTQHRVYASATAANRMVALDEDTGVVVGGAGTGEYPDGLAYDPRRNAVWTTNETGGSESVIDAATFGVRGTVELGGEVGNVVYDPAGDRMLVAVQGRGDLAVIDPGSLSIVRRIGLPGCDHPHGLVLDATTGAVFVGCDGNATLLSVDVAAGRVTATAPVGEGPDVLAVDPGTHRVYVAAESGEVTVLDEHDGTLRVVGSDHLADGAHVVAVDPSTHRSYYPIPAGPDGHPVLLERAPTP